MSHIDRKTTTDTTGSAASKTVPASGRIAIVDDEPNIRETVSFALEKEGYEVETYADGAEAWEAFEKRLPDLAILDILMPRMDGLDLCRRLRGTSQVLPILFLTSRDEEFDRVLGLELGADDYLCKPFSMRELAARIRVLFRRLALSKEPADVARDLLSVGPLELDLQRYTATWKENELQLTVTEFLILEALARNPGHVKTRKQLIEHGYPYDSYVNERNIDTHIKRIRRKFDAIVDRWSEIETVHGLGYRYREG